jgi:membrane protein CcdC involved in cytochrome C biogenesis
MNLAVPFDLLISIAIFALIVWRRTVSIKKPIASGRRLLLPLIFLIPGIGIFYNPNLHQPPQSLIIITAAVGVVLSIPLIVTSNYERRVDGRIYSKANPMFVATLATLLIVRLIGMAVLRQLDEATTTLLMYVLVVAYLFSWRIICWLKYRSVVNKSPVNKDVTTGR